MTDTFLTSGLLGWFDSKTVSTPSHHDLLQMQDGLNTSLEFNQASCTHSACASTGGLCSLDQSGIAAVIGTPTWSDNQLDELSITKGPATALAKAYEKHGRKLTTHISGNFSFVIIDESENLLLAAVDRLTRYPLYYTKIDTGIAFASAASALLAHPKTKNELCNQGLYNYVYFHMVPSPSSIYEGLNKLPAGHLVELSNGNLNVINYWKPTFSAITTETFSDSSTTLKRLLKKAVTKQLGGTGRVGAFLSGGLDSSTVTGMLSEAAEGEAEAFSIGFSAEGYDEMAYARITAKKFGVKLHEYYVTPEDVVDALPKVATSYDEPFGNSSALPAYFCAKVAKENGIDLLLAGDGGDELFAGNERYAKQTIFEAYHQLPNWLRNGILDPSINHLPDSLTLFKKAKSYIKQANIPLPDRLQTYNFLHRHDPSELFTEDFLALVDTTVPTQIQRRTYEIPHKTSALNRMLYLDWQYTLADNDLRKVSHMCAMAGVEVVYPMLDDELVEFSCTLPDQWKLKGQSLRHFYKESLTGWLPNETIKKRKQGFGLPFGVWMQTHKPLQEMAYACLEKLKKRQYFHPTFIDQVIHMHQTVHAAYYGELLWILTVLELWLSEHKKE